MSFDTWIHILEAVLVLGMFAVSWWVLKMSKRASAGKGDKKRE